MKDPYSLCEGNLDPKKPWISGGCLVASLPRNWLEDYRKNRFTIYVEEVEDGEIYIVSRNADPLQRDDPAEYTSLTDRPFELRAKIMGAYMRGDDRMNVTIPLEHTESHKVFNEIPNKLFGVDPEPLDSQNFILKFVDSKGIDIKSSLEKDKELIDEMCGRNLAVIQQYDKRNLEMCKIVADRNEAWLDKESFYWKRMLNKALINKELLQKMDIKDRRNVIYYETIVGNIERIGDLHKEISYTLKRMADEPEQETEKVDLKLFPEILMKSDSAVRTAFRVLSGEKCDIPSRVLEIDDKTGFAYADNYGSGKVEALAKDIKRQVHYSIHLEILQSRMWSIWAKAINIIEAKINMV